MHVRPHVSAGHHPGRSQAIGTDNAVKVSLNDLMNGLRRYLHVAERENVSRQIGTPSLDLEKELLQEIDTIICESPH